MMLQYTRKQVERMIRRMPSCDFSTPQSAYISYICTEIARLSHLARYNVATDEELQNLARFRAIADAGFPLP